MSKKLGRCVICGEEKAITRDHLPPKCVFAKPLPQNLITVPACRQCNNDNSQLDERFKVYLGLHVSRNGVEGERVFQESFKSAKNNKRLYREVCSKLEPTYLATKTEIIYGETYRVLWDSDAHSKVIERIIRGLYYHHFNSILENEVEVKTYWFSEFSSRLAAIFEPFNTRVLGQGEFIYKFGNLKQDPLHSFWLFQFHKTHWAGGATIPLTKSPSSDRAERVDNVQQACVGDELEPFMEFQKY